MKRLAKLVLLVCALYGAALFCPRQTDGFALAQLENQRQDDPRWKGREEAIPHLEEMCKNRFLYLKAGGQSYAFVSEDGRYVLKLFKPHVRPLHALLSHLPFFQRRWKEKIKKCLAKQARDYNSYKIAFEELKEECGLIAIHLHTTHHLQQEVRIVDKLNIEHRIDLDQIHFILQKKAVLPLVHFDRLIQENKIEEAQEAIDSICKLVIERCKLGIFDDDAKLHRNFGFLGNQAMLIDVGRFQKDERRKNKEVQREDLYKITARLQDYLADRAPQLSAHLKKRMEEGL